MYNNIKKTGLPTWSDEDQLLAKATQIELQSQKKEGLATKLDTMHMPNYVGMVNIMGRQMMGMGGGTDDIADISWSLPTIVLGYPSNIPGLPGHHWANAISMATPIAHKGILYGAKAESMTVIDFLTKPELVTKAWEYYHNEQTKEIKYTPLIGENDKPAIFLNKKIMTEYAPKLKTYYYNPTKYKTYLEQLGIAYPTVRPDQKEAVKKLTEKKP
jgi:aminobenzoyl-glutamate utilization protein B